MWLTFPKSTSTLLPGNHLIRLQCRLVAWHSSCSQHPLLCLHPHLHNISWLSKQNSQSTCCKTCSNPCSNIQTASAVTCKPDKQLLWHTPLQQALRFSFFLSLLICSCYWKFWTGITQLCTYNAIGSHWKTVQSSAYSIQWLRVRCYVLVVVC